MILELWSTQIAFLRLENIKIAFAQKYAISCVSSLFLNEILPNEPIQSSVYSLHTQLKGTGKLNCCLYRFFEKNIKNPHEVIGFSR